MRRTDRNVHAGMVITVRRSPVVDFEETALSVCPREKFRHVKRHWQYLHLLSCEIP